MASFYAIYHGPDGLKAIAKRIAYLRKNLEEGLKILGYELEEITRFDSIDIICPEAKDIHKSAHLHDINLRILPIGTDLDSC